jgi:hypothetical protein
MDFVGEKRVLNSELWHACAGPLVSLPAVGSRVVYFAQGHSEQVSRALILACFSVPTDQIPLLLISNYVLVEGEYSLQIII